MNISNYCGSFGCVRSSIRVCFVRGLAFFISLSQYLSAQTNYWQATNGPYGGSVNSIAVDSANNLFAATQHRTVLRSTNNGDTWTTTNLPTGLDVVVLAIDSASRILAGTSNAGVYRSLNQGQSWSPTNLSSVSVMSIALGNSGLAFVGTQNQGVYRSTDYGNTWTYRGLSSYLIFSLVMNASGYLFAGVDDSGAYRSTDQGLTWNRIGNGFYDGTYVTALATDRNDTLFAGTYTFGLWRSTNNGDLWTRLGSTSSYIRTIAFDAAGDIFLGSTNGVTRSTDRGITWVNVDSVHRNVQVNSIVITSSSQIIAGGRWRGLCRSTDAGNNWIRINDGFNNADVLSLSTNGQATVYAGVSWDGVYATDDYGLSWRQVWFSTNMVLSLAATDSIIIAAPTNGQFGIYRSTNGGINWVQTNLNSGVFDAIIIAPNGLMYAGKTGGGVLLGVFVSSNNGASWSSAGLTNQSITNLAATTSNHIFAGTLTDGIYRSTDDGQSWTNVASFNATIVALTVNHFNNVFAATADNLLYWSTNNGDTWEPRSQGYRFTTLIVGNDNSLIGGTGSGVFRSSDNGNSWTNISSGLQLLGVQSLVSSPNGLLFSGMQQGSAYRTIDSTTSVEAAQHGLPDQFRLSQNYPNPFNPSTTIEFSIPRRSHVTVRVFNILGEAVATLVDEDISGGIHKAQWDATGSCSGVYVCRMQADMTVQTVKLLLIK